MSTVLQKMGFLEKANLSTALRDLAFSPGRTEKDIGWPYLYADRLTLKIPGAILYGSR
jgi:hypothetical protein